MYLYLNNKKMTPQCPYCGLDMCMTTDPYLMNENGGTVVVSKFKCENNGCNKNGTTMTMKNKVDFKEPAFSLTSK